jgi:arginyl-tRNA synthetase
MSSRRGRVVLFKEVADEAVRRILAEIAEKNPTMPDDIREDIAAQVGLGALAYAMLSVDNNRDIVFDMDEALNFDGRTGPYIQNAYVRASSILRKAEEEGILSDEETPPFDWELLPQEIQLIEMISRFPNAARQAAEEYRPLVMANYAYELASAFHRFYHVAPVLQAESASLRAGRLSLVRAARQTLRNALRLLVIHTPEVM